MKKRLFVLLALVFVLSMSAFRESPLTPEVESPDWRNGTFAADVAQKNGMLAVQFYRREYYPRAEFEALGPGDVVVIEGQDVTVAALENGMITGENGENHLFSKEKSSFNHREDYYLVHGTGKLARPALYKATMMELPTAQNAAFQTKLHGSFSAVDQGSFFQNYRQDPYSVTVTVEDGVVTEVCQLDWNERAVFPTIKSLGELLGFDGLYNADLRWKADNIVTVDVFEYVCYAKEDVEQLRVEDIVVVEDQPMVIQLLGASGATFAEGVKDGEISLTFGPKTPLGSRFLELKPYEGGTTGDYCIFEDISYEYYCVPTVSFDIPVTGSLMLTEGNMPTQEVPAEVFLKLLQERGTEFRTGKNVVWVQDGQLQDVMLYVDILAQMGFTTDAAPIEGDVADAVNPYVLCSVDELFGAPKLPGRNGSYNAVITQWDGDTVTADLYGTEFYRVDEIRTLAPGDGLAVDGQRLEVKNAADWGFGMDVTTTNGETHTFTAFIGSQVDYCRMVEEFTPALQRFETAQLTMLPDGGMYSIYENGQDRKVSAEEFREYLQNYSYVPNDLTLFIEEDTVLGISLNGH